MFGRKVLTANDNKFKFIPKFFETDDDINQNLAVFKQTKDYVRDKIQNYTDKMVQSHNDKILGKEREIKIGDTVYWRNKGEYKKNIGPLYRPKFTGPYKVISKKGNKIEIEDLKTKKVKITHPTLLKCPGAPKVSISEDNPPVEDTQEAVPSPSVDKASPGGKYNLRPRL